jgi:hypothetical protein
MAAGFVFPALPLKYIIEIIMHKSRKANHPAQSASFSLLSRVSINILSDKGG